MAGSVSSRAAQSFTAPGFGIVTFDHIGALHGTQLVSGNQYIEVEEPGLYLIEYGVRATTGAPAYTTITFLPGGTDDSGKVPLTANTMVGGSIVRRMGALTRVSLRVDNADNNTTVTLAASTAFSNAYLNVTRVGPYPATSSALLDES